MNDNSKSLCFLGGVTAVLSGLLMIFLSYWFAFRPEVHNAMHGVSVVMLILVVPTVVAATVLIIKDAKTGALLGIGFATLWIVLELIAHCSQTAPLKKLNELIPINTTTEDVETAVKWVWQEWSQALTLIGAFLFSMAALCYGTSLRVWGNPASASLLILSAIVFALTFIPGVSFYWHILSRGIAFIFLGGVLMQASREMPNGEWEGV